MRYGKVVPYYENQCVYLDTTIYAQLYIKNLIDVVNELYKRTTIFKILFLPFPIYLIVTVHVWTYIAVR